MSIGETWLAGIHAGLVQACQPRYLVLRLCSYKDCDWRGTVDEKIYSGRGQIGNLADAEQLAHMLYVHGYPYQPWDYKAIRRVAV